MGCFSRGRPTAAVTAHGGAQAQVLTPPLPTPPRGARRLAAGPARRSTAACSAHRRGPRPPGRPGALGDVERGPVVRADREDDSVLGCRPGSQQPVAAVEVATARMVQRSGCKAVPRLLAAVRDQRLDRAPGGLGSSPAQGGDLALSGSRQLDVDGSVRVAGRPGQSGRRGQS